MKLYITTPSPFARKIRIVIREKGLTAKIEEIAVDPYGNDPALVALNPVVQVPTLVAEDGLPINDSPVIAQYLDQIGEGPRLIPDEPSAWLNVKRRETLANQVLEMGVKLVLEKRRPQEERSPSWIERWTTNMGRTLDALEAEAQSAATLDIAVITTGIAVTWLSFRHPDYDWQTGRPNLVALSEALEQRDSFKQTYPQ